MTIGGQLLLHDALKPPWRPKIAPHKNNRMRPAEPKVPENTGKYRAIVDDNGAVHDWIKVK